MDGLAGAVELAAVVLEAAPAVVGVEALAAADAAAA